MTPAAPDPGTPNAGPPDFPIEWSDPSDARLSWEWDDMHMPTALMPLAADYVRTLATGFAYGLRRLGAEADVLVRIWNGYAYFALSSELEGEARAAMFARRSATIRGLIPTAHRYWQDEAVPEVRGIYDWIASRPVETMTGADLAGTWNDAWTRVGRCWSIHFLAIRGPYQVLDDLADLYETIVPGAPPGEALAMVGGGADVLHDVERGLETLAALLRASPALAGWIATPGASLEGLAAVPGSASFRAALDAFLDAHGHLGQGHDNLALPSWAEDPGPLLADLARRLDHPPRDVEERRAELLARAEGLAAGVRARLAAAPDRLAAFEDVLAEARRIGPLTEIHNYWIDRMVQSTLRRFALRVGRRLVEADVIDQPIDIMLLARDEVPGLLVDPADRRTLVRTRRDEHERWTAVKPPRRIGAPPDDDDPDRFDGPRFDQTVADEVRGTGASAGIVRGTARVTLTQDDFGAVRPGDIIVCPSSNPSWVPLFAMAGGLITNTGGVLSHAAVVAREFGLPAVVGTGDATARIADGRLVELDGSTGIVRLL